MEKPNRKTGAETAEETAGKRAKAKANDEEEDEQEEDMMSWLSLDDDTMTELSKVLDPNTTSFQQSFRVRFIDNPYSPPLIVQSSSGYVTINGNEESCGSSFSDLESSAMASFDKRSLNGFIEEISGKGKGIASGPDADEAGAWMEENGDDVASWSSVKEIDGGDWFESYGGEKIDDDDDDVWGKFLGEDLFGGWNRVKNW